MKKQSNVALMQPDQAMQIDESLDYLMSTSEVASKLGCNQSFVVQLIDSGLLKALRFGKYRRVRKFTLNHFLDTYDGYDLHELVKMRQSTG